MWIKSKFLAGNGDAGGAKVLPTRAAAKGFWDDRVSVSKLPCSGPYPTTELLTDYKVILTQIHRASLFLFIYLFLIYPF